MSPLDTAERMRALSPTQVRELAERLQHYLELDDVQSRDQRLVAFVAARKDTLPSTMSQLRSYLSQSLPEHLLPSEIFATDTLPLTPNGKIDKQALIASARSLLSQRSRPEDERPHSTDAGGQLLAIWREVLGSPSIGIDDNFFEHGGDSILAIGLVAKARDAGIGLSISELFKTPTIKELVRKNVKTEVNRPSPPLADKGQDPRFAPLTPIQHWFLGQKLENPNHWNQSVLLELGDTVGFEQAQNALTRLWTEHDSFRLAIRSTPTQIFQRVESTEKGPPSLQHLDLSAFEPDEQSLRIVEKANTIHRSLNLASGKLLGGVFFHRGEGKRPKLLLIAHHLSVDAISWKNLFGRIDHWLAAPYSLEIEDATHPRFQEWAYHSVAYSNSPEIRDTLPYWKSLEAADHRLPFPPSYHEANTEGSAKKVSVRFDSEFTSRLIAKCQNRDDRVQIYLLAALAKALQQWTKQSKFLIGLEGHGRDDLGTGFPAAEGVGWFTSLFPVLLDLSTASDSFETLREVEHQVSAIPLRGISFGLLKYLNTTVASGRGLAGWPDPEIVFNYIGRILDTQTHGNLRIERFGVGTDRDPLNRRTSALEIYVTVNQGSLAVEWIYGSELEEVAEAIRRLSANFENNLRAVLERPRPLELTADSHGGGITHIQRASEAQQGLLLHHLRGPEHDLGRLQLQGELHGKLEYDRFEKAWNTVIAAHPALRSGLVWEGQEVPLQAVHRKATLPVDVVDWAELTSDDQAIGLRKWLENDRKPPLDLGVPPAMRFALFKLAAEKYHFVWTCHHIFLDGWSGSVVLKEMLDAYRDPTGRTETRSQDSFFEYDRWINAQPLTPAAVYWRSALENYRDLPPLLPSSKSHRQTIFSTTDKKLSSVSMEQVEALSRQWQVTSSAVLAGGWAVLVSLLTQYDRSLFALTTSGRSCPVAGMENSVGNFANALPVATTVESSTPWPRFFQSFFAAFEEARAFEHVPLGKSLDWAGVRTSGSPIESLLAIGNYPWSAQEGALSLRNYRGDVAANFPITVSIVPQDSILLSVRSNANLCTERQAHAMADLYDSILGFICRQPASDYGKLRETLESQRARYAVLSPPPASDRKESPTTRAAIESTPENETQTKLLQLWRTNLGSEKIDLDDDFFAVGGTSLQAIRLFAEIERTYQQRLPLSILLELPTPRLLSQRISKPSTSSQFRSLTRIQSGSDRPPLFFLHAAGAHVLFYKDLANSLSRRYPIYGLEPIGHDGASEPLDSIEAMADIYLEEIRRVRTRGPFVLLGHCFGAVVAMEIGRRLLAEGEPVSLLIAVDGEAPLPLGYEAPREPSLWRLEKSPREAYRSIRRSAIRLAKRASHPLVLRYAGPAWRNHRIRESISENIVAAFGRYRVGTYGGKVLAFRCEDSGRYPNHSYEEWHRAARELDFREMPCLHNQILKPPYAEEVARAISEQLQQIPEFQLTR